MSTNLNITVNNKPILRVNQNNNSIVRYNSISDACIDIRDNFSAYEIEIAILRNITYRGYAWKLDEMELEKTNTDMDIELK